MASGRRTPSVAPAHPGGRAPRAAPGSRL